MGNYLSWGEAQTYSEVVPGSQENAQKEANSQSPSKQNNFHLQLADVPTLEQSRSDNNEPKKVNYENIISKVYDYLYLGGAVISSSKSILQENKITHIINVNASLSPNYFENDFKYLSFDLYDHGQESLDYLLYYVNDYINDVKNKNGIIFLHCQMGISRSATFVLFHMMLKENLSYQDALSKLSQIRPCVSPHTGFITQLLDLQNRIQNMNKNKMLYFIAAFSSYQKLLIARILRNTITSPDNNNEIYKYIDNRGIFIVRLENDIYVWYGKDIDNRSEYGVCCDNLLNYLKKYEHFNGKIMKINSGEESEEFEKIIGGKIEEKQTVDELSKYYNIKEELHLNENIDEESDEKSIQFYLYHPDNNTWEEYKMFDIDDLQPENLYVICNNETTFTWIGSEFDIDSVNVDEITNSLVEEYAIKLNNKVLVKEGEESEDFWGVFE